MQTFDATTRQDLQRLHQMREYWDEEAANKHHNVIWDLPRPAIYREFVLVLDRVIERLHKP